MAISLSSSFLRALSTAVSSLSKGQEAQAPAAPEESAEAAPASAPAATFQDGFEEASAAQQQWAAKFGATPVIQQNKDTDCGAAAAAILAQSTGKPTSGSATQLMDELDSRFATQAGTTPRQLTDMLAHEGMSATKGTSIIDPFALDQALGEGKKAAVMVDSNKIAPGAEGQGSGKSHWVVLDGKDAQGNYQVKDPGTGTSYSVDINKLTDAVNSGWTTHNSGGMLIVDKAQEGANEGAVAETSAQQSLLLGNGPGVGSNAKNNSGREST
jgi:hypothetical protein